MRTAPRTPSPVRPVLRELAADLDNAGLGGAGEVGEVVSLLPAVGEIEESAAFGGGTYDRAVPT